MGGEVHRPSSIVSALFATGKQAWQRSPGGVIVGSTGKWFARHMEGLHVRYSGHRGDALLEPLQAEFRVAQFVTCFVPMLAATGGCTGRQSSFQLGDARPHLPRLILAQCLYPVPPAHLPSPPKDCSIAAKTLTSGKFDHSKFNER
jgi:hypothetical protein